MQKFNINLETTILINNPNEKMISIVFGNSENSLLTINFDSGQFLVNNQIPNNFLGNKKLNTLWITFDQTTGFYALGLKKKIGHKIIICDKINITKPVFQIESNINVEFVNYVPINKSPRKFDKYCNLIDCFGLTMICKLNEQTFLHQTLCKIQDIIKNSEISSYYGFTPSSSFHMTIFDLKLCEQQELNNKLIIIKSQLESVLLSKSWTYFVMKLVNIEPNAFHIALKPSNEIMTKILNNYRTKISELTNISIYPNYVFHITLCYEIYPVKGPNEEIKSKLYKQISEIFNNSLLNYEHYFENISICRFNNMGNFESVL